MADNVKETWEVDEVRTLGNFLDAFRDFIQEWSGNGYGFRVKDLMASIEDEDPAKGYERKSWGLVSLADADEVTLQYEQGEYDVTVA